MAAVAAMHSCGFVAFAAVAAKATVFLWLVHGGFAALADLPATKAGCVSGRPTSASAQKTTYIRFIKLSFFVLKIFGSQALCFS